MKKHAADALLILLADERNTIVLLQLLLHCIFADGPKSRSPLASDLLDMSKSLHFPKVIMFSKLHTDYRPYESWCHLTGSHDLFIAYHAILLQLLHHRTLLLHGLPTLCLLSPPSVRLHESRLTQIREGERIRSDGCCMDEHDVGADVDVVGDSTGATRCTFPVCGTRSSVSWRQPYLLMFPVVCLCLLL
jgi:hypothetical protein